MLPDKNLFFRDYSVSAPLTLTVHEGPETAKRVYRDFAFGGMRRDCLMIRMPMGTNFFTSIAVEQETWLILTVEGGAVTEEGHLLLENSGRLLLSAGLLPDAVSQMAVSYTHLYRAQWGSIFMALRSAFLTSVPGRALYFGI